MPNLEIRDRGILFRGRLISWLNIERYEWQSANLEPALLLPKGANKELLCLYVARRFKFLPPVRIHIERSKEELEAILKRHLSAWPE